MAAAPLALFLLVSARAHEGPARECFRGRCGGHPVREWRHRSHRAFFRIHRFSPRAPASRRSSTPPGRRIRPSRGTSPILQSHRLRDPQSFHPSLIAEVASNILPTLCTQGALVRATAGAARLLSLDAGPASAGLAVRRRGRRAALSHRHAHGPGRARPWRPLPTVGRGLRPGDVARVRRRRPRGLGRVAAPERRAVSRARRGRPRAGGRTTSRSRSRCRRRPPVQSVAASRWAAGARAASGWPLRVTLVFRHEASGWRLVHRHADALVHPIGMELLSRLARGPDHDQGTARAERRRLTRCSRFRQEGPVVRGMRPSPGMPMDRRWIPRV